MTEYSLFLLKNVPDYFFTKSAAFIKSKRIGFVLHLPRNRDKISYSDKPVQQLVHNEFSIAFSAICRCDLDPFKNSFSDTAVKLGDSGCDYFSTVTADVRNP